jgi:hypothetical protein
VPEARFPEGRERKARTSEGKKIRRPVDRINRIYMIEMGIRYAVLRYKAATR